MSSSWPPDSSPWPLELFELSVLNKHIPHCCTLLFLQPHTGWHLHESHSHVRIYLFFFFFWETYQFLLAFPFRAAVAARPRTESSLRGTDRHFFLPLQLDEVFPVNVILRYRSNVNFYFIENGLLNLFLDDKKKKFWVSSPAVFTDSVPDSKWHSQTTRIRQIYCVYATRHRRRLVNRGATSAVLGGKKKIKKYNKHTHL